MALGVALCSVFAVVIIATNLIAGYQRDDWRGIARSLPATTAGTVIVGPRFSSSTLSVYRGSLQGVQPASVTTREIDFVALRTRKTGKAPAPPVVPATGPAGFTPAGATRTESFAVIRFQAPTARTVSSQTLRRLAGDGEAELVLER